jgi:acyl carrier protein
MMMMDVDARQGISAKVVQIVAENFSVAESRVHVDTSFYDDLQADSLDTVELSMAFEEAFRIELPDGCVDGLETVGDAVAVIERLLVPGNDGGISLAA